MISPLFVAPLGGRLRSEFAHERARAGAHSRPSESSERARRVRRGPGDPERGTTKLCRDSHAAHRHRHRLGAAAFSPASAATHRRGTARGSPRPALRHAGQHGSGASGGEYSRSCSDSASLPTCGRRASRWRPCRHAGAWAHAATNRLARAGLRQQAPYTRSYQRAGGLNPRFSRSVVPS
jgi:hypothetical protein